MPKPKQIVIALLLLIVVSIPSILFVYFQARTVYVRHEMEEKLERAQLETIRLPRHELRWFKKNKEIIVNDRLFDVKSIETIDDSVVVTGLFDDKETFVKKQLEQLQEEQNPENDGQSITVKYVSILLYNEHRGTFSLKDLALSLNDYGLHQGRQAIAPHLAKPYPPPRA
jgi:hypothetical protein